nr:probable LRR receptor-like serine/threonine-protein kinase At1g53430 isoform X1 [Ipomoea batatas]
MSLIFYVTVEVLKTISAKLRNKYWNVTQTSCNDGVGLNQTFPDDGSGNDKFSYVICDCSFNGTTVCHVTDILLKGLSLPGVLPPDFAKLRFLRQLSLLGNRISGKIPKEIGDISTLEQLVLEDNELQGPLDENLGRLSNLNRLLLSANNITGVIPESFGNLKNLTDLIDGNPISGKVPNFIGNWTQLKTLDLSFNMLNGKIPTAMGKKIQYVDLSYNNLTESSPTGCQASNVNAWCSQKDLPCSSGKARYHSLFINCGGGRTEFEDNTYDEDFNNEGPSYFSASSDRWAYSSSGLFISNDIAKYVAANTFSSNVIKDDIYKTARLAPTSLAYYGFCMKQGSYKVVLHFAEIMFSNDSTYSSLGRRLFDVKIQGKVVLTDFNIVEEAKGAGIGITKVFDDVLVNGSTLEIHLYWTGKGTNAIPQRGVHGPLISAITVTPNFNTDEGLSAGAIVGIVISCCVFALLILVALRMKGYLGGKVAEDNELRALDLQTGYFTLRQVKAATNNFDLANKIGEGGFGPVYKGVLSDGVVIAVKQLSSKSNQGNREFINEIGMISALQHPNLVKLHGCCIEANQLLLIYEYMENNCLSRALFGKMIGFELLK